MRTTPHFVLVGAPKCGTTSLAAYLGQHPELFVVRGEPHFFGSDIAYNRPRMSAARYHALFTGAAPGQRCGERSTWYLMSERAAGEIHRHNPKARIIIQVRNPAELLYSLHGHHLQRGQREDIQDFGEALAAEADRRQGKRLPRHVRFPESLYYSSIPRFSEQIPRYLDRFGAERVRIILLDDLQRDPAATCADVFAFLGADPQFRPDFTIENRAAPVGNAWLHRLWKKGSYRYTIRRLIPDQLHARLRQRRRQRMEQRARRHERPPLAPALRREINSDFAPDIEYLQKLLNRDLSDWLR